ncbi:apolipoprotein N-acyltransferase [Oceaniferula spumae]|uniref:Apolipoprotein N-acyltransferase n=1 Tax=Oceaniferula spumae TaxID=2979115 RepID=A0AAT9FPC9_9BACT
METKKKSLWPWLTAMVSGLLLALCFPDWNLSGLVWVWMLLLLPAIWRGNKKRYGFGIAYVAGLVFWAINLKWLWTVSGLGAMVMAAFLACYFGLWGMIAVSFGNPWRKRAPKADQLVKGGAIQQKIAAKQSGKKSGLLGGVLDDSFLSLKFAFINGAAWVGCEWLRGWLFTGFSWNGLGVAFHDTPVLAQAADLVGVTGLAFMPVFMSAVIIQTGRRLGAEAQTGKLRPRLDFSVAALLLALQFCYGVWRVKNVNGWEADRVRILLVQENIPQDIKWEPKASADIRQGYADSTAAAIEKLEKENVEQLQQNANGDEVELKSPDLVVWPESALPLPLLFAENHEGYFIYGETRHVLENEVRTLGNFTLIAGMNEFEADFDGTLANFKEGGQQYNSIAAMKPGGELDRNIDTYRKIHLVIFGEYIPFVEQLPFLRDIFKFSAGADFAGGFTPGTSTEPLTVPVGDGEVQLIPTVCFEDGVGRLTRKFVRQAPQVIVNVTNDGWFKQSEAAVQHMANAKFRAIELRRPMIRSANTGVSAIISATGSSADPITGDRQVIEDENGSPFVRASYYGHAYAPKKGQFTLYAIAGDWFSFLMIGLTLFGMVRARLNRA